MKPVRATCAGRESSIILSRKFLLLSLVLGCAFSATAAAVEELILRVEGIQCSLCARTIERVIGGMDGVSQAAADPATYEVRVAAQPGRSLDVQGIRKQLAKSGFPPATDEVILAVGTVNRGPMDRLTFKVLGTRDEFDLLDGAELRFLLQALPAAGPPSPVEVRGRVHRHPPGLTPSLSLLSYEVEKRR